MRILASVAAIGLLTGPSFPAPDQSYDKPAQAPTSNGIGGTHNPIGKKPKPKGPIDPHHPGGVHASQASGRITSLDATAKTITVKDTYNITDDTKFVAKGKAITLGDLHVGDTVTVTYSKEDMKASKVSDTRTKM